MNIKKILFGLVIMLIVLPTVNAQRNPAKSADEAFEALQYSVAIDRYKT